MPFGKGETEAQGQGQKGVRGVGRKSRSHGPVPKPRRPLHPQPLSGEEECRVSKGQGKARETDSPVVRAKHPSTYHSPACRWGC